MKTFTITVMMILSMIQLTLTAQWTSDPAMNTVIASASGEEVIPKIAWHPSGVYYMAWFSSEAGNYNVRLQKLDFYGNKLWQDEGLLVSSNTSMTWLTDWSMTVDHDTCAILAFQDIRTGNNDIYVYRISPSGEFLWGADGIALTNDVEFDATPQVTVTDDNNCVFAWSGENTTQCIKMQKVSPEGQLLWGAGLTLSGSEDYTWPVLIPGNGDQVMLGFFKQTGPFWAPTKNLYIQRFDSSGQGLWGTGEPITTGAGIPAYHIATIIQDGNDGAFLCWFDDRDANDLYSVFAQHVNSAGVIQFMDGGVETSNLAQHHLDPAMAYDPGSGDLYVIWCERDGNQNDRGISGQRISPAGENLWTDAGKVLIPIGPGDYTSIEVATMEGDAMFLYFKSPYGSMNSTVNAMRVDPQGNFVWSPTEKPVSTVSDEKLHMDATGFDNGQFVAVWEDLRNGAADIYAQNLLPDGSLGPVPYSLTVTPDTLWFQDHNQFINGLEFYISNNSPETINVDNLELWDNFSGACMWWVEPANTQFPLPVEPNATLTFTVYLSLTTTDMGLMLYDTLNITSGTDEFEVILKVDSDLLAGTSAADAGTIFISPNPVKDNFTVRLQNSGFIVNPLVSIHDSRGNRLFRTQLTNTGNNLQFTSDDIGITDLPEGVYVLRIISGESVFSKKLVITH